MKVLNSRENFFLFLLGFWGTLPSQAISLSLEIAIKLEALHFLLGCLLSDSCLS